MRIQEHALILDDILDSWYPSLGGDFIPYKNHCYRVLNFCLALCGVHGDIVNKVSIAVAFHDLGIWTNNTFDYLLPSRQLAREYLAQMNQDAWGEEIAAMIEQHHKIRKYKAHPNWLIEPFRKADWIDVSKGKFRFGLSFAFIDAVMSKFPNAGFHKRLVSLTIQRLKTHPFSPLPMMRL